MEFLMSDYFISDLHLGHDNILKFEPYYRPFATIEEHNSTLIENWNRVVKKGDRVFCLGDFAMGSQNIKLGAKLNGQKYLILGNHDTAPTAQYLLYFHKCLGVMKYKNCILSHVPIHPGSFGRAEYNIHGHIHSKEVLLPENKFGNTFVDSRYINVSVEQINLTPISFEDLIRKHKGDL